MVGRSDDGDDMGMKGYLGAGMVAALCWTGGAWAAPAKPVPYWASLTQEEARMRVGPSLDYPSNWVYRRRDLPVKVVQVLGLWRKVEDPSGTQGWMHVRLLSDRSEEHTSELQSLMSNSYAVFCLKKKI